MLVPLLALSPTLPQQRRSFHFTMIPSLNWLTIPGHHQWPLTSVRHLPTSNTFVPQSYSTDAGLWNPINEELRSYWIRNGPNKCRNKDCDFSATERIYQGTGDKLKKSALTESCFRRVLRNDESSEWILYSHLRNQ